MTWMDLEYMKQKKQIQNASHYMIRLRLPEKDKAVRIETDQCL